MSKNKLWSWFRILVGITTIIGTLVAPGLADLASNNWRAFAWNVQVGAHAKCLPSGDEVGIGVAFGNNDTRPISVTATDEQTGNSVDLGTVQPGEVKNDVIGTGLTSIGNGRVRFDMQWADDPPGSDVAYADYEGAECVVPPTSTPEPTATTPPEPTATNTSEPTPTEQPVCTVQNLSGNGYVNIVNDTMAAVQADAGWDAGPDEITINFFGPGNDRQYRRGDPPIPPTPGWEVPRQDEDYQLTLKFSAYEGGELCATDVVDVTIPAMPAPEPSQTPTLTATWTPSPTATQPPEECVITDLKGRLNYTGNHMSGNPVTGFVTNLSDDPACQDELYLMAFGSNQEPESDGWLESQHFVDKWTISVPPGTVDAPISQKIDTSEYCWYQVDLLRTNEVREPPYYSGSDMVDYVFVQGRDCRPATPTLTATNTPTLPPGVTPSPTATATKTLTPTNTPTPTSTLPGQPSPTATQLARAQSGAGGPSVPWQVPSVFGGFVLLIWGVRDLRRRSA